MYIHYIYIMKIKQLFNLLFFIKNIFIPDRMKNRTFLFRVYNFTEWPNVILEHTILLYSNTPKNPITIGLFC